MLLLLLMLLYCFSVVVVFVVFVIFVTTKLGRLFWFCLKITRKRGKLVTSGQVFNSRSVLLIEILRGFSQLCFHLSLIRNPTIPHYLNYPSKNLCSLSQESTNVPRVIINLNCSVVLSRETALSFERLVVTYQQTMRCYNPEDLNVNFHRHENSDLIHLTSPCSIRHVVSCLYYTECGPNVLGLTFKNRRHIPFLFKISSIGIYTGFCAVVQFLKSCQ